MKNLKSGFAEYITKYLDWREAIGYSRATGGAILARFDKYCSDNLPDAKDLTRDVVGVWMDSETTSIPNKITAIRNFARYMKAHGHEAYEYPASGITPERTPYLPYKFTKDELVSLFSAIDKIRPTKHHPNLPFVLPIMLRLIYSCGLRPNEGRELIRENIDFDTGAIHIVNTKGKKERTVVMSDDMRKRIIDYDKIRKEFAGANPYFFPAGNGCLYKSKLIQKWLKDCWVIANPGIPVSKLPDIRVYDLRHVFAATALTRWIEKGANINAKLAYLQAYMGHDSINETLYYVHLLPETLLLDGKWNTLTDSENSESKEVS
jgi:integrase